MKKIRMILFSFLFWIPLLIPSAVSASSESIQSFDTKIIAHKDGSFDVIESIKYDFGDSSQHGIYRDIPTVTKVGELYRQSEINITNVERDNNRDNYSVSKTDSQVSVKIGRPDQIITGEHTYTISYRVKNGIGSNYTDHDEIYWNVTGNGWKIPIISASATISTDFGVASNQMTCFTGLYGSQERKCNVPANFPQSPITTTIPLAPGQGLTVVAGFPVNTFPKSVLSRQAPVNYSSGTTSRNNRSWLWSLYFRLSAILNFVLAPGILIWYLKFKRKKRFGPVTVNFDLPKDWMGRRIAPAEAGTIDNATLDRDDVVATIFDLAIRKYIKIEQIKRKKTLGIFGGGDDYAVLKLKSYDDVESFEKVLLDRLFQDGDTVEISSLKTNFYETFQNMDKEVFNLLVGKMYYAKNPKRERAWLIFFSVKSLILLAPLLSAVLFFLASKLNGRTAKGDEIDFKIDGLKLFLKNMSREYKWQAENLYIVESYIPYAMALGYIDEFMKQLKIIYPNYQPNWYSGNMAFYAISANMISSMNTGFTTVAPSSSSGFSGGGFSGGGGGGGGGESW